LPLARRVTAAALLAFALVGVTATAASAGWSQPIRFAGPFPVDILPAQISFSGGGAAAVAYTLQDAGETAVSSSSLVVVRPSPGRPGSPRAVPAALQVLNLGFAGSLTLLTGTSPSGESCCTAVQLVRLQGGRLTAPQTLLSGLTGGTLARFITVDRRRALAVVATGRGVWVTQSGPLGRFPPVRRLTAPGDRPLTLAAASLSGDRTVVAWAAASAPRTIFVATGSRLRGPRRRRAAIVVRSGHDVDELAVVRGPSQPTIAWIEEWFHRGGYRSQPVVEDLVAHPEAHPFPIGAQDASGLAFAADGRGDQVISWEQCGAAGVCDVIAASRPAQGRFGVPQNLGSIDPSQSPAVTISPRGEALVGWIHLGQVLVAASARSPVAALRSPRLTTRASSSPPAGPPAPAPSRSPSSSRSTTSASSPPPPARFGSPAAISRTSLASDLSLAFGPTGEALAVWTQGIVAPTLQGAVYRP